MSQLFGTKLRVGSPEEKKMLLSLEDTLGSRVLGQPEPVAKTSALVRRARTGLGESTRPASILYTGGTGRGKTELAKSVAEVVNGSRSELTYLAMGDYSTHGQAPAFAKRLAEQVAAHPGRPILLDEIEKAEPGARKVLLEVLEEGRIVNPETGKVTRIPRGIVMATTNVEPSAFAREFPPEFTNRFDDIAEFGDLGPDTIRSIATQQLGRSADRVRSAHGVELEWSDAAVEHLAVLGYDPKMGARPMRRAVQDHVDGELAKFVLQDDVPSRVRVEVRDGQVVLDPQAAPAA